MPDTSFTSLPFSANHTVTWAHIGDTHLTRSGEQNEIDLGKIVDQLNAVYANKGLDFVFVPGDIADDGSVVAYEVFRKHLDRLQVPWVGIVGDHDVHEKSFDNFRKYVSDELYSAFTVGPYTFLRLNAFSEPRPDAFIVSDEQLRWLDEKLNECTQKQQKAVIFLHCYPSDLKQGGEALTKLLHTHPVLLVDMGHTHYNELSNDGHLLYSATRSTGQIEEGSVGYSITTLDGDFVSWHFVALGSPALVNITQPLDDRLENEKTKGNSGEDSLVIHAKVWSDGVVTDVRAELGAITVKLQTHDGVLWEGSLDADVVKESEEELNVIATQTDGKEVRSSIRVAKGAYAKRTFHAVDQDNAIDQWEERGLLGTQLGPNKNGKKW